MNRMMCLWFPHWPIQRHRVANPPNGKRPLALYSPLPGGRLGIVASSPGAVKRGVRIGLPLAEARAIGSGKPPIQFDPADPTADLEALRTLALKCQRYGPWAALDGAEQPDSLIVDVNGCGPFFGGERGLAETAVGELQRLGYYARSAIADTVGASWAIAHFAQPSKFVRVVTPGEHRDALLPLPIEALRLSPKVVALLAGFQIRRIEQLLALPRADLPSRFGPEVGRQLDRAFGEVPDGLRPETIDEPIEVAWAFEPPTGNRLAIEPVLEQLLELAVKRVVARRVGIQRLICSFRMTNRERTELPVGLVRPTTEPKRLYELLRLNLERVRLTEEVSDISIRVVGTGALELAPVDLFGQRSNTDRDGEFNGLIERLSNRLGREAVRRPERVPDHQPEKAIRFRPFVGAGPTMPIELERAPPRPTVLYREPVRLIVPNVMPGTWPREFRHGDRTHRVSFGRGPERIETGWWRGRDVRRDYFVVETSTGQRFWLFFTPAERAWFLHGEFA